MSVKLYFITGKIVISRYMVDREEEKFTNQLVWADDEEEAKLTFYEFWESKTRNYEMRYRPCILEITEALYS